jgi:hypothetical protein
MNKEYRMSKGKGEELKLMQTYFRSWSKERKVPSLRSGRDLNRIEEKRFK